ELDPTRGFVAESVAAIVLYVNAFWLHAPVSTTHTITSAIMGVGATKRLSAVRWGVAKSIAMAWVLTIPAAAVVAGVFYLLLDLVCWADRRPASAWLSPRACGASRGSRLAPRPGPLRGGRRRRSRAAGTGPALVARAAPTRGR